MQNLHNKLAEHSQWYAKWHEHPKRSGHHFGIMIAVALIATTACLIGAKSLALSYDQLAQGQPARPTALTAGKASQHLPDLTTKLLQAVKQYQKASQEDKSAALDNLVSAALARREAMLEKATSNPQDFLLSVLPEGLAKKLPAEISGLLEQETEVSGALTVSIAEYFDEGHDQIFYELADKVSGKKYDLHFAQGEPDNFLSGDYVKAKGVSLDNNLVLAGADDLSQQTVSAQITAGPTGDQHVLAMLVNFTNYTSQPWTPAQVAGQLFPSTNSTNAYYVENSFNKTYFDGDATNWITVPYTNANCSTMNYTWATAADQAATAMGYNLANYNRKLYVMAGGSGCGWAGLSNVGGNPSRSWTNNYNSATLFDHELGHAIGMRHASSYSCGTKSIDVSANCTLSEYGDLYDTMGNWNTYHLNSAHKVQQTYIPPTNVKTVTASSGVYTIYPIESTGSAIQAIKLNKPDTSDSYYLEYRQAINLDKGLPSAMAGGIGIHIWGSSGNTKLLDTTPGDANFSNSFLADGRSFQDQINGITITQLSHDAASATVQIVYGPAICYKSKPSVTVSPLTQQGVATATLKYNVTITNNDTPSCVNSNFAVSAANLPSGFSYSGTSASVAPGSSAVLSLSVTSPVGFPNSSNVFTVTAADASDATHSNTAQATYIVFTDLIGPTVVITSPVNGSALGKSAGITISASATDNVGISKVEIYVDNKLMAIDISAPYTYKWNVKNVTAGAHTITVQAYDKLGNMSSASAMVYK